MVELISENYKIIKEYESKDFSSIKIIDKKNPSESHNSSCKYLFPMLMNRGIDHLITSKREGGQYNFSLDLGPVSGVENWDRKKYHSFFSKLISAFDEAEDCLIEENQLLLHKDFVFIDDSDLKIICLADSTAFTLKDLLKDLFFIGRITDKADYLPDIFSAIGELEGKDLLIRIRDILEKEDKANNKLINEGEEILKINKQIDLDPNSLFRWKSGREDSNIDNGTNEPIGNSHAYDRDLFDRKNYLIKKAEDPDMESSDNSPQRKETMQAAEDEINYSYGKDKKMSLFYLLTHFSRENLNKYRSSSKGESVATFTGNVIEEPEKEDAILWEEDGKISLVSPKQAEEAGRYDDFSAPYLKTESGLEIKLSKFPFTLGRDPERVDYSIADRNISDLHAKIEKEGDNIYIYDCASFNSSFINNRQLIPFKKYRLKSGDRIRLADREAIFFI